jgi:hypothetical protein
MFWDKDRCDGRKGVEPAVLTDNVLRKKMPGFREAGR